MPLARTLATSEVTAKGRSNGYTARLEWPPSLRQVHSELPCSMMATKRFETGQEPRRRFENQEECLRKSPRRFPRGEDMFIRSCRVQWWQLKMSETRQEPKRRSEHPTTSAMRLSQRASSHVTTGSNNSATYCFRILSFSFTESVCCRSLCFSLCSNNSETRCTLCQQSPATVGNQCRPDLLEAPITIMVISSDSAAPATQNGVSKISTVL